MPFQSLFPCMSSLISNFKAGHLRFLMKCSCSFITNVLSCPFIWCCSISQGCTLNCVLLFFYCYWSGFCAVSSVLSASASASASTHHAQSISTWAAADTSGHDLLLFTCKKLCGKTVQPAYLQMHSSCWKVRVFLVQIPRLCFPVWRSQEKTF